MLTNPVILSVALMLALCFFRFNVLLAVLLSGLFAGLLSSGDLLGTMQALTQGMKGNLETALSYILVGALAAAISRSNLMAYVVKIFTARLSNKRAFALPSIAAVSCLSQNLIPVHIAFVPILIPPLLPLFSRLKIDRRALACAITFGLGAPYMALPLGFGLIFQTILKDELNNNNVKNAAGSALSIADISSTVWLLGPIMLFGLICALVAYRKPREYKVLEAKYQDLDSLSFSWREGSVALGLLITLAGQVYFASLPLATLLGLLFMIATGGVKYADMDDIFSQGLSMMGYIAFVMLVAAGYGEILRGSGAIDEMVRAVLSLSDNTVLNVFFMLLAGLIITLGIGTSFGTIPIIAVLFCPICQELGLSTSAIIFIIAVAGVLGDAGSPASDSAMGVSVGTCADNQADHIKDTCLPNFLCYNMPLLFLGLLMSMFL